jgi:probable F420-dependent oxidoreductase
LTARATGIYLRPTALAKTPSIGLFAIHRHLTARDDLLRIGTLCEELGYDSLWMGEHVVVPDPRQPPSPMEPLDPILDPLVALAFIAARTERILLATGIVILPQRNPLVLAKQLASLDWLSGGRVLFGMGVGYLEPEMTAVGVPMDRRGTRAVEYLKAMRALWEHERPSFEGEFVRFSGVNAHPRPAQRPLPVIMAGHSAAAHRRAARHADGWYGFMLRENETAEQLEGLRKSLEEAGRDISDFEFTVTPRGSMDADRVAAFRDLGVNRLVLIPPVGASVEEVEAFVREHAPERLSAAAARA